VRRRAARPAVVVRVDDGVARVTLARSETCNRLDLELCQALVDVCAAVADEPRAHVVVLEAAGRDFSVGLPPRERWLPAAWPDPVAAVAALPQPVVAAIDGDAVGWGFGLALACDIRIASPRAVLVAPELATGRMPGGGITQRLPRVVGSGRAMALLLLGERLRARVALDWGLVTDVVASARLARVAAERARALARRGPLALRFAKEAVRRALDLPLADGVRLEHDLYVLLQTTADRREGVEAFLARRPPRFQAR
jgi:enoyl-CoA hydratase/carnithine racemase